MRPIFLLYVVVLINFSTVYATVSVEEEEDKIIWCTVTVEELRKCNHFAIAVEKDYPLFGDDAMKLECKEGFSKDECMTLIDEGAAHITLLDAGEVFVGGRYHSLLPILQERLIGGRKFYYSVAVIKRNTLYDVNSLYGLRGKRACFPGVGTQAGWTIPIHTLMRSGGMHIIDCNNHVKSTINYFGPSCAVNSLIDKYNPIGDNSDRLCELCIGKIPGGKCTTADPYAGFEGAFRCLVEKGEIAFLKHSTVAEMTSSNFEFSGLKKDNFELLCTDGSRRPVDDYNSCNWGPVQSHAIVTSTAQSVEQRRRYQNFFKAAVRLYGTGVNGTMPFNPQDNFNNQHFSNDPFYNGRRLNSTDTFSRPGFNSNQYRPYDSSAPNNFYDPNRPVKRAVRAKRQIPPPAFNQKDVFFDQTEQEYQPPTRFEPFHLFQSAPRYGFRRNLLLSDSAEDLLPLEESAQTYTHYLGRALDLIFGIRQCPVNRMRLCVTSDPELEKCIKMQTALKAQLLKPEMSCIKGHSHITCMEYIRDGTADVTLLDASDVYTAGFRYDLIPFIAEVYNLGKPEYFVVAVAKEQDPTTELTYLKGKYTCHTGMNTAAGWVIPMAYLTSNNWIRSYGCDSVKTAAEYFGKSCIPGALSTEYNIGPPYENLCHLCHGASSKYCRRDASEDFYGYTGALRCVVEGGGDVAFVKHTTISEVADGKRNEWWARNALNGDFELLCPDGRRMNPEYYEKCNLGRAKANAVVTRGGEGYNETQINAFINLFIYAQQFYGRRNTDEFSFSMFYSQPPYSDLIFQDATQQLMVLDPSERRYDIYLGRDFLRARRVVDCYAGSVNIVPYSFLTLVTTLLVFALNFM